MNTLVLMILIIFSFIVIMTIVLNFVEKERIPLMIEFFEKVLTVFFKNKK